MQLPNTWIEKGIEQGIEKGIERGIEKGIEQGEERGRRRMAIRQLSHRLGLVPESLRERVESLSGDQLDDLAEALLDFSSLADLERWLAGRP